MFFLRRDPGTDGVGVACTDASVDVGTGHVAELDAVRAALGLDELVTVSQVHGVAVADADGPLPPSTEADALVTTRAGVGLCIRVADCVPVLLHDATTGVLGAAHAGRKGFRDGVLPEVVAAMRDRGATHLTAWVGPHVCGECYEVPQEMVDDVAMRCPAARARTSWGTPSLDLGAGAAAQLRRLGVTVEVDQTCTRTTPTLHSYRRDQAAAGRLGAVVWRARA